MQKDSTKIVISSPQNKSPPPEMVGDIEAPSHLHPPIGGKPDKKPKKSTCCFIF